MSIQTSRLAVFTFTPPTSTIYPRHKEHSGQTCFVVRQLTSDEADAKVGPMFEVKFTDGFVAHVFADELEQPS